MASLPLEDYEFVHATDPDRVRDVVGHSLAFHDLGVMNPAVRIDARVHCRRLQDTAITFITYGGDVVVSGGPLSTYFALAVPLTGTTGLRRGQTDLLLTTDLGAVVSPSDEEFSMFWQPESAQLVLRIEQPALEAHLSGLIGEYLSRPLRFQTAMPLSRNGGRSISTRLRALVRDLDRGTRFYGHPLLVSAFEQSMMTQILLDQPHNYSTALENDVKPIGSRDLQNALALMESHPESALSPASVARVLSISGRSLERRFRRDLSATFLEVLRGIRLRRAHDDLRHASPDATTINDVFARWSLTLDGHTYSSYRDHFHETPAETLRRRT